ncbi:cyclic peptide export ABC transporter [Pyxidicoccus xibeiensis]|uniref:cyclic peptide export ABC transporter n=1 Tax=Pyxidicoccus xibeiensis TaxID=2906759 RepID=UPI0020A745F7|nr:cyclic peptide export ABC transporter [Pyxidicoccus xibeiensis]MCP3145255.1 cyclic peptide export ABC transporter [Pyxidicoccus xibeiensis]
MKLLLILLRKSMPLAVLTVVFGLLSGASSASLLALINQALTRGTEGSLSEIALPFVGIAFAAMLTRIGSQYMLNRLQHGILVHLRMWLSRHLLATSLRTLESAGAHRMLTSLMQDIGTLSAGVLVLPDIFISSAIVLGGLIYLGWLSWPLCLAIVVLMVLGQLTYTVPAGVANKYAEQGREQGNVLFKHFLTMSTGAKELRLNRRRRRDFFELDLGPAVQESRRLYLRTDDLFSVAASWGMSLYVLTIGLLLIVGPRVTSLTQTELFGAVLVVLYFQQPLNSITASYPAVRRGEVALAQIEKFGVILAPEEGMGMELPADTQEAPRTFERIEMAGVTHTYRNERDGEQFTLGPINLSLERGQVMFLVGGNGSGKTTLAKVLSGLYAPESGELRVDGTAVPHHGMDDYRQLFSAVFYDFFLFERLVGGASPDMLKQARDYLEHLHLDKKVTIADDGKLSTTALSQGQRKRLALLMAYLEDRPVYLFDEWAADQDPQFKEVFYRQILQDLKARGKAVVVISHDDRYFHLADRLVRIESGQLIFDGKPDEPRITNVLSA